MSVRSLPIELKKVAENELNENPNRVLNDIQHVKEWISKQAHLPSRTDDQWILAFLRGCKFSLQKTKQKVDLFYTMRSAVPEYVADRDVLSPENQDFFKRGFLVLLPNVNPTFPRVMLIRGKVLDPEKISLSLVAKATGMIFDLLVMEDDAFIVAGQYAIFDLENLPYAYIKHMTPVLLRKWIIFLQDAYPTRPKGLYFVNVPPYFITAFNFIKTFTSEKVRGRIHFYTKKNIDKIYNIIPRSAFPKEYGGDTGPVTDLIEDLKERIGNYREWLIKDAQYCSDESKRLGKAITSAEIFGIEGSFRKLQID